MDTLRPVCVGFPRKCKSILYRHVRLHLYVKQSDRVVPQLLLGRESFSTVQYKLGVQVYVGLRAASSLAAVVMSIVFGTGHLPLARALSLGLVTITSPCTLKDPISAS